MLTHSVCVVEKERAKKSKLHWRNTTTKKKHKGNWNVIHVHIIFKIATVLGFLAVTDFPCNCSRLLSNQETEEMRLKNKQAGLIRTWRPASLSPWATTHQGFLLWSGNDGGSRKFLTSEWTSNEKVFTIKDLWANYLKGTSLLNILFKSRLNLNLKEKKWLRGILNVACEGFFHHMNKTKSIAHYFSTKQHIILIHWCLKAQCRYSSCYKLLWFPLQGSWLFSL